MFSIHFLKKKPLDEYNETLEEFKIKFAIFSDLKEHEKIGREKVTKKQFYKKKDDDVSLEKDKEEEEKNKNKEIIKKIKLRKYNKDRKKNGLPVKDENSLDKEKNVDKNDEKSLDKDNEKKIIEEITKESDDESDKDKSDKDKSDKDESDKDESDKEDSDDEDSDDEDDKEKCYYIYNIYYNGYFQKISRWWNSENRGKTLMYLKEDFTNFIKFLNDIKNKYNFYALNIYYKKLLKNIHKFINLIMPGLYNLKKTYKNEIKIKAQIDSIILTMIDFKNETQIKKNTKTLFSQLLANPIGFCSQ